MAYIGTSPSNGVRRRFVYEATASQTSFSGSDENGVTLTYVDSLYLDVFQNGIKLKAGDDYTATTGTSVVLVQGASANDVVEMVAFDIFSVGDTVSAKDGGSFAGNVAMGGTLAVTGNADLNGDLDVDGTTNLDIVDIDGAVDMATTLKVGGSVGIGMTHVANYGLFQLGSAVTSALGVSGLQAFVSGTNAALGQNGNMSIITTNGQAANLGGSIGLGGKYNAAGNSVLFGQISGRKENATDANSAGYLQFASQPNGGVPTERMRIDSTGNLLVSCTVGMDFGASDAAGVVIEASNSIAASRSGQATLWLKRFGSDGAIVNFYKSTSAVGSISVNGSSTAYNTSSDYRLKENVTTSWDATTRLKQLKPSRFNFITDADTTIDGFLAHEVSSIVPEAISGTKDAMTAEVLYVEGDELPDGKVVGDVKTASAPDYQGIDQSKLVPLLVKTIQELEARITALENA